MDLSKHGGSAYEFPGGGGLEGRNSASLDASRGKANLHMNKVHPEGKYKVSMVNIDDDATNVSDTVQTIGVSEASVANPNNSID